MVVPSGNSAQERSSRMLRSHPGGGRIFTLNSLLPFHAYYIHWASSDTLSTADTMIVHELRKQVSIFPAFPFLLHAKSRHRARLSTDAAADTETIIKGWLNPCHGKTSNSLSISSLLTVSAKRLPLTSSHPKAFQ